MLEMETIKLAAGTSILVIGLAIHLLMACARFFHLTKPAFLIENIPEIAILTVVSMLMGILLIFS